MDDLGNNVFDAALTRGATAVLGLAAAWSLAVLVTVAAEAGTSGRVRIAHRIGCPAAVRCWLLGIFVVLLAGVAPAEASDVGSPAERHGSSQTQKPADRHRLGGPGSTLDAALDGLTLPDRAVGGLPRTTHTPRANPPEHTVTVQPGDSLWRIARAQLPAATDGEVSRAVAALYASNRAAIGADPDLLRPGQHLDFPTPPTLSEEP